MVQLTLTVEILAQIHKCVFFCVILQRFPKKYILDATSHPIFGHKRKWLWSAHSKREDLEYQLCLYNASPLKASQMQPHSPGFDSSQEQLLSTLPQQNLYSHLFFFFWKSITCPAECSERGLQVTFSIIILSDTEELFKSYTLSRSCEGTAV